MKMKNLCGYALAILAGISFAACGKQPQEEENNKPDDKPEVIFSLALNSVAATEAEVIVRHTGTSTDSWFGFLTEDLTADAAGLIQAQIPNVNVGNLHIGTTQTVQLKNLSDNKDYRYIVFGVNTQKEIYGKTAEIKFTTDADLSKAVFTVSAKTVEPHSVTVAISHAGYENFTWYAFVTTDLEAEASALLSEEAANIQEGALNTGTAKDLTFNELQADTKYRVIAGGVKAGGVIFGTPAEAAFETPLDLNEIQFSTALQDITKNSATIAVSYSTEKELSWFGIVTKDMNSKAADLVAAANVSKNDWKTGPQTVELTDLEHETDYRYIVSGINNDGKFGIVADQPFTTLSSTYEDCVFAAELTSAEGTMANFAITHNGKDEFEYTAFVTADLQAALADLVAALPASVDENLIKGNPGAYKVMDLNPETDYRLIVVGRVAGNSYGTPADVPFKTPAVTFAEDPNWTLKYEGYQSGEEYPELFSMTVATPGISGKYILLKAEKADMEGASVADFMEKAVAPYIEGIMQPSVAAGEDWSNLLLEDNATDGLSEMDYDIDYVIFAVGITPSGYATGHYAYTEVNKPDTALKLSYEDYLGTWKIDGNIWTISEKVNGKTYNIDGIPGYAGLDCGNSTVVADYNAETGKLTITEQEMGEYNDPDNGPTKEYFSGATTVTLTSGDESLWPLYPQQADKPSKVLTFAQNADGSYVLRPNNGVEAVLFAWVIQTGEYAGYGNIITPATLLPNTNVEKVEITKASYSDFLGEWMFGDEQIMISQKEAGSTYSVTGFSMLDGLLGDITELEANYDEATGQFYMSEQTLGSFDTADHRDMFGSNQYGVCDEMISGIFEYGGKEYFAYPWNTKSPSRLFTGYLNDSGEIELMAGSCQYGQFVGFDAIWVIRTGQHAGNGNNWRYETYLPEKILPMQQGSEAYSAWLGKWSLPCVEYQYDASGEYTGDKDGVSILTIRQKVADESYLIKGIGPKNTQYEVVAQFDAATGSMVVRPQVVEEWVYEGDGLPMDITECLIGWIGEEGGTWSDEYILFTATLSGNTATLTPGEVEDGYPFTGFQFFQAYEDSGYGYGGEYVLPNTMTRQSGSTSVRRMHQSVMDPAYKRNTVKVDNTKQRFHTVRTARRMSAVPTGKKKIVF